MADVGGREAETPSDDMKLAHLKGAYDMCGLLLTSPRFNKPQREVIEYQAYQIKDQMEVLGATFSEVPDE